MKWKFSTVVLDLITHYGMYCEACYIQHNSAKQYENELSENFMLPVDLEKAAEEIGNLN